MGVACLVAIVVLTAGCKSDYPSSSRAATSDPKTAPRQVKTATVTEMPIGETVTVNGTLAAFDHVTVGMKVPGRLQTISIDLGIVTADPERSIAFWISATVSAGNGRDRSIPDTSPTNKG